MTTTDQAAKPATAAWIDDEPPAEDPVELAAAYRRGDFLLASPERTILAQGVRATISNDPAGLSGVDLADAVQKRLRELDAPLAAGALPFDRTADAHLVVPERVRIAGPLSAPAEDLDRKLALSGFDVKPVPEQGGYRDTVATAVRELTGGKLRKVVLARALELAFHEEIDDRELGQLLLNLAGPSPRGYTFATPLPCGRALIGASPELLLSRTGRTMTTFPLAGSMPRMADPAADQESAARLAASAKDQGEHRVVIEDVVETLRPFVRKLSVPDEPSIIPTPSVWHLGTRISAELVDPDVTALHLATALYPTPALCGAPRQAAYETITELEPFNRGFYGGAVGWCDVNGDGQFAVAIRCAELAGRWLQLYAGCGIMPDSDPEMELDESTAKFRTLLGAMGLVLES
ncbi:isochorismate synthase [Labedaea rhizosphaerae]|uniref:isochorismate synthase n=1 Tax=Labedaea rhizosphaerae TaxID=598644 RepID=A0A4R6SKT1_LABRH|nr:isochorismate synthase [Labedaea rhizosphaerae]TDQ04484.1 isochorismate synthase [Labedaea rhizosphaerae]